MTRWSSCRPSPAAEGLERLQLRRRVREANARARCSPLVESSADSEWARVRAVLPDAVAGRRATLVQFSSAFCAPCRATRRVLAEAAELVPGVRHVEVDAEQHLMLVRALDIAVTPTTLVLGEDGRESSRAAGAPTRAQVLSAIAAVDLT